MSDVAPPGKQIELSDLQSVKVGIGDVVQLQDFSHEKLRHYVKLIGYLHKKSVLVSHPIRDEKLLFIRKGESFLVRGFSGTRTYEFTADVVNVCLQPYPYLHLSYPAQISTVNMRAGLRIKLRLVCSVRPKDSDQSIPATIEDMSISGARIQSRVMLGAVGDKLEVSFRLPIDGVEQLIVVPATLRNVGNDTDETGAAKPVLNGLEFHQPEGIERTYLHNYIYKYMAES
jgi:c-di-GMP-binding flagellar brake protein YcgR